MSWLPDWLTGFDRDNYEAGKRADDQLAILNAQTASKYEADYGPEFAADWKAQVESNNAKADDADPDAQITGSFWQGWNEGADSIRNGIGSTINTAVGTPLRLIPWQVWLALAVFAAFKLGLFKDVLKRA